MKHDILTKLGLCQVAFCQLLVRYSVAFAVWLVGSRQHGLAQTTHEGEDRTLEYIAPWPPWISILLLALCGLLVYSLYARETPDAARWKRSILGTFRFSLVCIVLWMMYGFTERPYRTDLPDLLLIVDDSPSMDTVDSPSTDQFADKLQEDLSNVNLAKATRLNQAKSLLLRNDSKLLEFLSRNYQVKLSGLDVTTNFAISTDIAQHLAALATTGEQSRLGDTVRKGLQQRRGRPVAAILFLTDGITTEGPLLSDVSREARQRNVPLHIVGLGSKSPAKDLKLSDLLVNDVVFVGDRVTFDVTLSASDYAGEAVEVVLRRKDGQGEPTKQRVQIRAQQDAQPVRMTYEAAAQGIFDFIIEVLPQEGEVSTENNQLGARVEVRDEKTRVLFVQSYPNFQYHYLRTLLQREARGDDEAHSSVELSVLLQDADAQFSDIDEVSIQNFPSREELFQYDVCIFGDVNPSYLSNSALQDIRDFIMERGRGFIGIAGPRYFPSAYAETPLAEAMPFEIRNVLAPPADLPIDTGFQPQLTDLGHRMPAMQLSSDPIENATQWHALPELHWLLEVDTLKMGTRTLMEHPTRAGTSGQPYPVVSLSYAGAGKVLFHYTDDSWRWRIGRGDEIFGRYWQQSIRYLSRFKLGEGRDVELTSDRDSYKRGESARLRARFFDDRLAPSDAPGVIVMLEQEGSRRQQVKLSREGHSAWHFFR